MHKPGSDAYAQLWRVVDGAVRDAFAAHPDFLTEKGKHCRASVTKRVVGNVLGFALAKGREAERDRQRASTYDPACTANDAGKAAGVISPVAISPDLLAEASEIARLRGEPVEMYVESAVAAFVHVERE